MSYTYTHVIAASRLDEPTIVQAVTETLQSFRASGSGELLVVPVCPKPDFTILEIGHDRSLTLAVDRKAPNPGLARGIEFEIPFPARLAAALAPRAKNVLATLVTDQTEGWAVVSLAAEVRGARCDQPAFFGGLKYFLSTGTKEWRVKDARNEAALMLGEAVGERFAEPMDYLHWYGEWTDTWLAENFATVEYPRSVRVRVESSQISSPELVDSRVIWQEYFP